MSELISNYVGTLITISVCIMFGKYILKESFKIKKVYVFVLIIFFTLLIGYLYSFNVPLLRTVAGFLYCFLMFRHVFNISSTKSIITTIVYYVLLVSAEILFFILATMLFKISGNAVYIEYGGTFVGNILVGFFCLTISFLLRSLIIKLINKNIRHGLVIYWAMALTCIILFLLTIFSNSTLDIETFLVLGMISVMLVIILVSFYQTYKNNELTNKYDKLLEFIKKYENEIDLQRTLRHETKNQLLIIKSKLVDKDNENSVIEYIDEILDDNNKEIKHSEYAKLRFLPSNGIKGLFYFKVSEAIDKKIKVDINVSKAIEKSFICNLNSIMFNQLGKILGIFLDNAIEGSEISDKKEIGIEVYSENENVIFIISNTYIGNLSSKNGKSTKGPNRGHGLLLARSLINSNNRFINETSITDKLYIQKLIVKK